MKKIVITMCAAALFTSCGDFLEDTSGDLLIPKRVSEFTPLLYGEGYPHTFNEDAGWFKLMTDDVEMGFLENADEKMNQGNEFDVLDGRDGRYVYLWDYNMGEKVADNFWDKRYANILGCNAIIEALPTMDYIASEMGNYNYLAAQAYALRAYHYFCLINTYALPYSKENLDKPGVILRTTPETKVEPIRRSSIGEVWEQINSDLETAIDYMGKATPSYNLHLISPAALWLLASRVALFQEKWNDVAKYGERFLQDNKYIFDLNTVDEEKLGTHDADDFTMMNAETNKEIVFTFGNSSSYYEYLTKTSFYNFGFRVSIHEEGSLVQSYDEDDLRKKAYFAQDYMKQEYYWEDPKMNYCYHYPIKFKEIGKNYHENWRTVEVYLNLAEAYARRADNVSAEAIDLLNQLRVKRFKTDRYQALTAADFGSKDELVRFIWAERRRELCFEEAMRFWDLRREGMPQIEHKWYTDKNNYERYILQEKGHNYIVQIPLSETSVNKNAKANERDVIKPQ